MADDEHRPRSGEDAGEPLKEEPQAHECSTNCSPTNDSEAFMTSPAGYSVVMKEETVAVPDVTAVSTDATQADWFGGPEGDEGENTELLREAEVRAEQQEMARRTMLSLAEVLEDMGNQKNDLAKRLAEEQRSSAELRAGWSALEAKVERMTIENERHSARELFRTGMENGNSIMWPMMLEKSREGIPSRLFGPHCEAGFQTRSCSELLPGDTVTIKWVLFDWKRQVMENKRKKAIEAEEEKRKKAEQEMKQKLRAEMQATIEQWKLRCEQVEQNLSNAKKTISDFEQKYAGEEQELARVQEVHARERRLLLQAKDELSSEIIQLRTSLSAKDALVESLQKDLHRERENARRREREHEFEVQQQQDKIRKLTGDLDQAVILARHMRETALKAKRDAAKSVSPEKFSQLVAQLEDLRDQLAVAARANEHLKSDKGSLQDKLNRNQRRMELERQFLPLVHGASGPLGHRRPDNQAAREKRSGADERSQGDGQSRKVSVSQSLPALPPVNSRAGGPLGASL